MDLVGKMLKKFRTNPFLYLYPDYKNDNLAIFDLNSKVKYQIEPILLEMLDFAIVPKDEDKISEDENRSLSEYINSIREQMQKMV